MAQKKKKKTLANPARGFATVSTPSKPKDDIQSPENSKYGEPAPDIPSTPGTDHDSEAVGDANPTAVEKTTQQMSPEELEAHLEDAELQNVIDSNSTRIKAEASRQVARLQNERRQLRSQSHRLSTPVQVIDELVESVLTVHSQARLTSRIPQTRSHPPIQADTDDVAVKLWLLQQIFQALRFPRISDVLEHITYLALTTNLERSTDYVYGLSEALDWYALNVEARDLPDYQTGLVRSLEVDQNEILAGFEGEAFEANSNPELDESSSKKEVLYEPQESEESPPLLSDVESDEGDDPSKFSDIYVRYQTSLFRVDQHLKRVSAVHHPLLKARKTLLEGKIQNIERDPLFDVREARQLWTQTLRGLSVEYARSSERSAVTTLQDETAKSDESAHLLRSSPTERDASEMPDMLGGMFEDNQNDVISQDGSKSNQNVRIVNFGSWTGAQPRRLLEDACKIVDGKFSLRFGTLSSTSYSSRMKLDISWTRNYAADDVAMSAVPDGIVVTIRPGMWSLDMVSLATSQKQQSEAYLSTLALFLVSNSESSDQKLFLRLPKIFRELYHDLSESRHNLIMEKEKADLAWLRRLVRDVRRNCATPTESHRMEATDQIINRGSKRRPQLMRLNEADANTLWATKSSSSSFAAMQKPRMQLPINSYKDEIVQSINQNHFVILCADTGAGKSTQVPAFILEKALKNGRDPRILVTQPRRISAISLARRVSEELGEPRSHLGTKQSLIGYAIRLESKTCESTRITYATTGVLLRMLESDPELSELDYLILDEVHERTMDLDLLFIALIRLQQRRRDLRIVLMSATVDAQKFSRYFGDAPVLNIPGRTYPVEVYYLEDAIEETLGIQTVGQISQEIDEGFEEVSHPDDISENTKPSLGTLNGYSSKTRAILEEIDEYRIEYSLIVKIAATIATKPKFSQYSKAILIFMPGIGEIRRLQNLLLSLDTFNHGWIIHVLHSSFSTEDLEKAFAIPPVGYRKIVIATNIAETGITIPDVTAVIDTCKEKIMRFDERRQISRLIEGFISRSSARQRKGRAARVQEGICFHLVTRHRYESLMTEQHTPEMLRLSLQDPILRIKIWNLGSIEDTLAAAIDPPTAKNVRRAIDKLKDAGALDPLENLTALGHILARLPLDVAMGKLAVFSVIFQCLDVIITAIAMLSSKSPFTVDKTMSKSDPRLAFSRGDSDLLSSFNAYSGWKKAKVAGTAQDFCRKNHLNNQSLLQIEEQKIQLLVYLVDAGVLLLSTEEKASLNRARSSGIRRPMFETPDRYNRLATDSVVCMVIALAFYPRVLLREGAGYRNVYTNQQVSLGPSSVNRASEKPPKWVCFYEAMQAKSGNLNVFETSRIPEEAIVLLMGEADFKLFSGIIVIDNGRTRFSVRHWRQVMGLKILRGAISDVLDRCFASPGLATSVRDQGWIEEVAKALGTKIAQQSS